MCEGRKDHSKLYEASESIYLEKIVCKKSQGRVPGYIIRSGVVKRLFDFVLAVVSLALLGPLLLLTGIFIKLDSVGFPFSLFNVGLVKMIKNFLCINFGSMSIGTPNVATDKLTNSQSYITNMGYYL